MGMIVYTTLSSTSSLKSAFTHQHLDISVDNFRTRDGIDKIISYS